MSWQMSCHYFDWDICFYLYKMVTRYAARIIFGAPALREKIFFFDSLDLNRDQTTFIFLFERTNKPKRSTSELEKKGFVLHSRKRHEGRGKKDHQFTFNDPVCLFVCSVSSLLGWFTGAASPPQPPQVRSGERKK